MADYWKSQGRKFCDFCKCWIADNKPSVEFHEGGKKHKENVSRRLKEIYKNSAKQAKQNKKFESDIKKMENAAMAAYLKDVENNTKDITAERMISEKLKKPQEINMTQNPNFPPPAAPETNPRFRDKNQHRLPAEIDPCDPAPRPRSAIHSRIGVQGIAGRTVGVGEPKTQGKSKASKGKGKGKKTQEDDRPNKLDSRKVWYEALSPEGYSYYWHIETNESIWDPPEEGFMTIAEQEEEAKEQAVQEEFFEQIEKEGAKKKAEILEEQRANGERERLREIRRQRECEQSNDEEEEEQTNYRRDYSVPEKSLPYGSWQTVQIIEKSPVNLQLPEQKFTALAVPTLQSDLAPPSKTFKEKTITHITTGESDDEGTPTTFKKRKLGNKSVRRRLTDD